MSKPIIVFDLDGTLVDTAPDLLDSLNYTLVTGGLAEVNNSTFRRFVGMGSKIMIERAYNAQQKALAGEEHKRMHDIFLDHYMINIPGRSQPYPGVVAAMVRFADAGYMLAVCTNKYEKLARDLIDRLGLADQFTAITGPETFGISKPDPRHLTETIAMAGGNASRAVMVGDSITDIDTAKAAGIPVVAVDFGYTDRHVSEFEPSAIISHYDELTLGLTAKLITTGSR